MGMTRNTEKLFRNYTFKEPNLLSGEKFRFHPEMDEAGFSFTREQI